MWKSPRPGSIQSGSRGSANRLLAEKNGMKNAPSICATELQIIDLGGLIRTLIVSLLGAAALTAGILVIRNQREAENELRKQIPAGEKTARTVSLEKLRELGL